MLSPLDCGHGRSAPAQEPTTVDTAKTARGPKGFSLGPSRRREGRSTAAERRLADRPGAGSEKTLRPALHTLRPRPSLFFLFLGAELFHPHQVPYLEYHPLDLWGVSMNDGLIHPSQAQGTQSPALRPRPSDGTPDLRYFQPRTHGYSALTHKMCS